MQVRIPQNPWNGSIDEQFGKYYYFPHTLGTEKYQQRSLFSALVVPKPKFKQN